MTCTKCNGAGMTKVDERDDVPTVDCGNCNRTGETPDPETKKPETKKK